MLTKTEGTIKLVDTPSELACLWRQRGRRWCSARRQQQLAGVHQRLPPLTSGAAPCHQGPNALASPGQGRDLCDGHRACCRQRRRHLPLGDAPTDVGTDDSTHCSHRDVMHIGWVCRLRRQGSAGDQLGSAPLAQGILLR